ncbi:MAG: 3-deoxy-7-phosphoheptulonate synthase, partial [Clostridia bacterium]|nr:3-deoxy-7-phosphoheptulonate synthase [Clostridia bacterium]
MIFERKLTIPKEVKEMYPLTEEMKKTVEERNRIIRDIFTGKDDRLILVIGPCSADREDSVLDYISRLCKVQEKVKDEIFIIPRIYTNKPRTTGDGYKGMLHQPDPEEKPDMFKGIVQIRELHMRALSEYGCSCADEMLYPENYRYLDDVLAYVAVGARSVENQQHRLTASGILVPVGMKNPTSGDLSVMMNAITAAQHKHTFIYRGWEVHSEGNDLAHAILRGSVDKYGKMMPNYHYEDLINLYEAYAKTQLQNPAVIIDTNHCNSGKDPLQQSRIVKEVLYSCKYNPDIKN